ncbi:DgyrCDS12135 [Dimorphilus gyrociliatus]|uniref:DgyrCDS12135 n=1 Tax=Dimorphilus gyrociliatus TaxID=2664684 RepID=A0A7I8W5K1_9ANNE|nr:DgyrCDS12135 [Dimorphilus gyrociliatus]
MTEISQDRVEEPDFIACSEGVRYFYETSVKAKQESKSYAFSNLSKSLEYERHLKTVTNYGLSHGLSPDLIHSIICIVSLNRWQTSVIGKLLRSCLPANYVQSSTIVHAIGTLTINTVPMIIKKKLVTWIVIVFNAVDDMSPVHRLYEVVFNSVGCDPLRAKLCQILYRLTRRKDVTYYRIQELLKIRKRAGNEPGLIGLLSIYKLYKPSMITISLKTGRKAFFNLTNKRWRNDFLSIQHKNENLRSDKNTPLNAVDNILSPIKKKAKIMTLPSLQMPQKQSRYVEERVSKNEVRSVIDIKNLDDLLNTRHFLDIELPCQMASLLQQEHFYYVLSVHPDPSIPSRISFWLKEALLDVIVQSPDDEIREHGILLKHVTEFTSYLLELFPVCVEFLLEFLPNWNGSTYRTYILELLKFMRFVALADFQSCILQPLKTLFLKGDGNFKIQLINCLTGMFSHLATIEYNRIDNEDIESYGLFEDCEISKKEAVAVLYSLMNFIYDIIRYNSNDTLMSYLALNFYYNVESVRNYQSLPLILPIDGSFTVKNISSYSIFRLITLCCLLKSSGEGLRGITLNADIPEAIINARRIESAIKCAQSMLHQNEPFSTFMREQTPKSLLKLGMSEKEINQVWSIYRHPALLFCIVKYLDSLNLNHPDEIEKQSLTDDFLDMLEKMRDDFSNITAILSLRP